MHGYKMKIRCMRSQDREWGHAGGGTAVAAAAAAARPQKILCMVHGTAVQLYRVGCLEYTGSIGNETI